MERVVFWVVASVKEICVSSHVFVDVLRFDFEQQAVRVGVQELALLSVLHFEEVVEEVVHQDLAVLEDCHPRVDRLVQDESAFVHLDSAKVVCKELVP